MTHVRPSVRITVRLLCTDYPANQHVNPAPNTNTTTTTLMCVRVVRPTQTATASTATRGYIQRRYYAAVAGCATPRSYSFNGIIAKYWHSELTLLVCTRLRRACVWDTCAVFISLIQWFHVRDCVCGYHTNCLAVHVCDQSIGSCQSGRGGA